MRRASSMRGRGGFTLVEAMVAASVLALMSLAFLEGVIVAARIARENSERMAAEAFAFDLAWMKFNEEYKSLALGTTSYSVADNVPVLASWPAATAQTYVYTTNGISGKFIVSRVRWGRGNELSASHCVYRADLSRVARDR